MPYRQLGMKITNIHLKNFKRFTDLRIEGMAPEVRLVLLIGSNGSGKSSLFDAFGFIDAAIKQDVSTEQGFWEYYSKKAGQPVEVTLGLATGKEYTVSNHNFIQPDLSSSSFYGRTSFRQIPRLTRTALGQGGTVDFERDTDRPRFYIERDNRFENDIERITEIILKDFFRSRDSKDQIHHKYIHPINKALVHIFGAGNGTRLQLIEIIPPLEGKVAQITFRKGDSEIHYNYLSAGEKEVFNLLINLLSRASHYRDTIYFLDELDLHLNTKVQYHLLKEITEHWIPDGCQLWTASHSLGFIEYARQADAAQIIDFDDYDFDVPRILSPEPKDNPEIYEIAVGKEFLPSLFRHMRTFFVENKDKEYFATLGMENTVFVSSNNRNSVYHKVRTSEFQGIIDRDFLTDEDIELIHQHYPRLCILLYYSIENYLYHPDNLAEFYKTAHKEFDAALYRTQLTEAKESVKNSIIPTLMLKRTEYPFFGEPEHNGNTLQNRFKNKGENEQQAIAIGNYLNSNEFETFYKALPMKSYCTHLPQRQHIPKSELAQTQWFRAQIKALLR